MANPRRNLESGLQAIRAAVSGINFGNEAGPESTAVLMRAAFPVPGFNRLVDSLCCVLGALVGGRSLGAEWRAGGACRCL